MGWWDDVTGFLSNNKGIINSVATLGSGFYNNTQKDNSRQDYINYLKQQEQANYDNFVANANAANANSAANARASAANANARNAAAAATEKNAQAAAAKANKASQKGYAAALGLFAPYIEAGKKIVPAKTETYLDSLKRMSMLGQYLDSPEQKANANASIPSWEVPVQLPDYMFKR